ncbi:Transposon Ty3-G Gag-Pol polyprotein [Anabarilius grahami]|uniref:ribonuclease H n=1 Tax=Anabarilius grahami TaxID=495550 RepID=A0A3N0YYI7_ANAGA|nr:Transposon Ty3-G Gag-Pol polyprotein [Anabarilius grahami]
MFPFVGTIDATSVDVMGTFSIFVFVKHHWRSGFQCSSKKEEDCRAVSSDVPCRFAVSGHWSDRASKESVAALGPPQKAWGQGQGAVLLTLPPSVLQGAAVSTDPPRRVGQRSIRLSAGAPRQINEPSAQKTPETSLEGLVPLVEYLAEWKCLPNISKWVLLMIEQGDYRIQFGSPPPKFNGVLPTVVAPEQSLVMEQEVTTLLQKGAIERVPPPSKMSGFYSRYFIVPKKDGGLRPIIDLRVLNRSVKKLKFKMLTLKQIIPQIRSEDWFVAIDLKDAYFHVSIHPSHRKFLRFAFGGEAYQYRVLPFGLSLSPRTFTKCVDAALAPLRLQGIRVLNYIDDWLILAQTERLAVQHRDVVLSHMKRLGLRLNAKKSVLVPSQVANYLGVIWDSTTMQAQLTPARVNSILGAVKGVKLGQSLTVKQFQRLLGLMAAASNVITIGLLYMRPLQWWLRTKGFSPRGNPFRMIKVTRRCLRALVMCKKPWFLSQGPVLGTSRRRVMLTTDASLTGWGAIMSGRSAQGLWEDHQLSWHINRLEMMAVFFAVKYFLPDLRALKCGSRRPVEAGAEARGMESPH